MAKDEKLFELTNFTLTNDCEGLRVLISRRAIVSFLWEEVTSRVNYGDDACCDWATDHEGNTYIMFMEPQKVSANPVIARMVDVANYLTLGEFINVETSGVNAAAAKEVL